MKNTVIAAATAIVASAFASTAQAADIAPAAYDWTGFYIGANAGVAWGNSEVTNKVYSAAVDANVRELENSIDGDEAAFTAGGILGFNYQIDQIVLGIETDFNYLGFSDSGKTRYVDDSFLPSTTYTTTSNLDANWFGTIRGRLGYAFDNVLIYGTGGLAYGDVEAGGRMYATNGVVSASWKASDDDVKWGWTVGGGAEYGIDNWSLGLEYLYVDLGEGNWSDTNGIFRLHGDADYAFSTVRASVKYRFQ